MRPLVFATVLFLVLGIASEADANTTILLNCSLKCVMNCAGSVGMTLPVTLQVNKANATVIHGEDTYKATFGLTYIVWTEANVSRFSVNRSTLVLTQAFSRYNSSNFDGALFQGPCKRGVNQI